MAKAKVTPPVSTTAGQVTGLYEADKQIAVFKGIPYARPPVGPLRWRPPQPVAPWSGVRPAEKYSPMAFQLATGFEEFLDAFVEGQGWGFLKTTFVRFLLKIAPQPKQSEDCLYLNVRTPTLDTNAKLPVMVWIHGGDHQDGSSSDIFYESSALARRGVVLVSINYRLGLMGYFAHPELSRESEQGVSGNYGTLDQIAALRWVQDNIRAFGGDPDNVTIFGESAGGESVVHMLTSPLARGLFHKAIIQSAANSGQMIHLRQPFMTRPAQEEAGKRFADLFVAGQNNQVEALRGMDAAALYTRWRQEESLHVFHPVIDGYVLAKSPFAVFHDGEQAPVPLLLGSNADEGSLLYPIFPSPLAEYGREHLDPGQFATLIRQEFGEESQKVFALYPGLEQGQADAGMAILGDSLFGVVCHFYALQATKAGQPVYHYFFTRTPPSPRQKAGAYHAAELTFVHGSRIPLFDFTPEDAALQNVMGDYWTQFAKTGDPNQSQHPHWPRFDPAQPKQMRLGVGDQLGVTTITHADRYAVLQKRLERMITEMKQLREPEIVRV